MQSASSSWFLPRLRSISHKARIIGMLRISSEMLILSSFLVKPVTRDNMNYTSAALGVIGLISLVTWLTTGREKFTGPLVAGRTSMGDSNSDEIKEERK
jgi:choline transport protein